MLNNDQDSNAVNEDTSKNNGRGVEAYFYFFNGCSFLLTKEQARVYGFEPTDSSTTTSTNTSPSPTHHK